MANYSNNKKSNRHSSGKARNGAAFGYVNGEQSRPWINGWNASKHFGMRKFFARPYAKTKRVKGKNGKEYENWFVTVQTGYGETKTSGIYNVATKSVFVPSFNIIIAPFARRKETDGKGYCGQLSS